MPDTTITRREITEITDLISTRANKILSSTLAVQAKLPRLPKNGQETIISHAHGPRKCSQSHINCMKSMFLKVNQKNRSYHSLHLKIMTFLLYLLSTKLENFRRT